uniref:Uncharacterized protein n=1 Tax=Solanum lycopersicum TaxID=4081 RepID=A0A3Q7F122_SOLLC
MRRYIGMLLEFRPEDTAKYKMSEQKKSSESRYSAISKYDFIPNTVVTKSSSLKQLKLCRYKQNFFWE